MRESKGNQAHLGLKAYIRNDLCWMYLGWPGTESCVMPEYNEESAAGDRRMTKGGMNEPETVPADIANAVFAANPEEVGAASPQLTAQQSLAALASGLCSPLFALSQQSAITPWL